VKKNIFLFFVSISFLLHFGVLIFCYKIYILPSLILITGIIIRLLFKSNYLVVFSFLFPILSAFAYFESKGLPFNYILLPLFLLFGIFLGDLLDNRKKTLQIRNQVQTPYIVFLSIIFISVFFVILRWSNVTLSPLALFKNTPISPNGERLSFGIIFVAVYLGLFNVSYLYYLFLQQTADKKKIIIAFLSGHSLSIICSFLQHFFHLKLFLSKRYNGLASDSSSFGLLSAVSLLLSWYIFYKYKKKYLSIIFLVFSLSGIFNSFIKIGALAILFAIASYIFSAKKHSKAIIAAVVIFVILTSTFLFFNPQISPKFAFITELKKSIKSMSNILSSRKLSEHDVSNIVASRYLVWNYAYKSFKKFPLAGVGVGNFLYWVIYNRFGKKYRHHLPQNQYLLFSTSIGLIGILVFLYFLFILWKKRNKAEKWLLFIILFFIFFNHYLWFPECFLVFWIIASLRTGKDNISIKKTHLISIAIILILFTVSNICNVNRLHPKNWAMKTETRYDYGFWYKEKNTKGEEFRWTKNKAGIYTKLNEKGISTQIRIYCGAPIYKMRNTRQKVEIFWKGKLYKEFIFRKNKDALFQIKDKAFDQGFIEFRIHPSFNLKKMKLGEESRDLGIIVYNDI